METAGALIAQFAATHPFYFGGASALCGFFVKAILFTKENARRLIRAWFNKQRTLLKRAGRSDAEIKAIMQEEADFLLSAAQEAKDEANAAPAP